MSRPGVSWRGGAGEGWPGTYRPGVARRSGGESPGPATVREVPRRPPAGGAFWRAERASFGYAFEGLGYAWRTQRHVRIHAGITLLAVALGLVLRITPAEWAALVAMVALVMALELLNTVVEVVVDLAMPDYHPQAKVAKDVAAAAVLVAAGGAVLVGALIFVPRLATLLLQR